MPASGPPASGLSVGDKVEVQIEKIVFGGEGLARMPNGMILFIPFTAAGDVVQARLVRKKSKVAWGEVISITNPARVGKRPPAHISKAVAAANTSTSPTKKKFAPKKNR